MIFYYHVIAFNLMDIIVYSLNIVLIICNINKENVLIFVFLITIIIVFSYRLFLTILYEYAIKEKQEYLMDYLTINMLVNSLVFIVASICYYSKIPEIESVGIYCIFLKDCISVWIYRQFLLVSSQKWEIS